MLEKNPAQVYNTIKGITDKITEVDYAQTARGRIASDKN